MGEKGILRILNYDVQREIVEETRQLYALIADMKAACDRVERGELVKRMLNKKEVPEQLKKVMENTCRKTVNDESI